MKKSEKSLHILGDTTKRNNLRIIGVPEGEGAERQGAEGFIKEKMILKI